MDRTSILRQSYLFKSIKTSTVEKKYFQSTADIPYPPYLSFRSCLDFTVNKFNVILFCLFKVLFGIFTLFFLANRPLFAATKQCKSTQKHLSTKLEIKSKHLLRVCNPTEQLAPHSPRPARGGFYGLLPSCIVQAVCPASFRRETWQLLIKSFVR